MPKKALAPLKFKEWPWIRQIFPIQIFLHEKYHMWSVKFEFIKDLLIFSIQMDEGVVNDGGFPEPNGP